MDNETEVSNSSEPIRVDLNKSGKYLIGTTKFVFFAGLFVGSMLVSFWPVAGIIKLWEDPLFSRPFSSRQILPPNSPAKNGVSTCNFDT